MGGSCHGRAPVSVAEASSSSGSVGQMTSEARKAGGVGFVVIAKRAARHWWSAAPGSTPDAA
eukprot:7628666-Alexandrium_andersonii.AAC.1